MEHFSHGFLGRLEVKKVLGRPTWRVIDSRVMGIELFKPPFTCHCFIWFNQQGGGVKFAHVGDVVAHTKPSEWVPFALNGRIWTPKSWYVDAESGEFFVMIDQTNYSTPTPDLDVAQQAISDARSDASDTSA